MCRSAITQILSTTLAIVFAGGCATSGNYDSTFTGKLDASEATLLSSSATCGKVLDRPAEVGPPQEKPYFVEFRARGAYTYGHACVVFGKLDRNGRVPVDKRGWLIPPMTEITGLHPPASAMAVGHVIPVPAMTGPTDGDHEDAYILKRYRIDLTEAEFKCVVALIKSRKDRAHVWHGPFQNCVTYLRLIAHDLGLEIPDGMLLPPEFVANLERLNRHRASTAYASNAALSGPRHGGSGAERAPVRP